MDAREQTLTRLDEMLRRQLGKVILDAIADPMVTDILVNDDGLLWIERHGESMFNSLTLPPSHVEAIIGTVAASLNTVANAEHPILEGELPIARIRFEGLLPPIARRPCFAMRKPANVLYTLDDYVRDGIISDELRDKFRGAIKRRENIILGGGTGSGKTTLAGAIINEMVVLFPEARYVIIEDTLELQCRAKNLVQLHTSDAVDMLRLVRTAMRMRPDRIIVGETRGAEALAMLKGWQTGHPGGVTTVHANSATGILTRLASLIQEAGVPPQPDLLVETVHYLAFIERLPNSPGRAVTQYGHRSDFA